MRVRCREFVANQSVDSDFEPFLNNSKRVLTPWLRLTILSGGRTARTDVPLCAELILLSKVKQRSIVWSCLVVVTLVTGLGQSLHQLAGIRHTCNCDTSTSDNVGHSCADNACPFVGSESDGSQKSEGTPTSSDCCSVCRLLAQLGNGFFYLPAELGQVRVVVSETTPDLNPYSSATYFSHSPRGPPCVV